MVARSLCLQSGVYFVLENHNLCYDAASIVQVDNKLNSQRLTQNLICIAITAVVVIGLLLMKPTIEFSPRGVVLPTKAHSVSGKYTQKGVINVMLHGTTDTPSRDGEQKIADYALKLGMASGASGIVIQQMFYASPQQVGKQQSAYLLTAMAVNARRGR